MYKDYLSVRVQQINVKEIKCLCRRVDESSCLVLPNNWIFDHSTFAKNIIDISAICHFGLILLIAVYDIGKSLSRLLCKRLCRLDVRSEMGMTQPTSVLDRLPPPFRERVKGKALTDLNKSRPARLQSLSASPVPL